MESEANQLFQKAKTIENPNFLSVWIFGKSYLEDAAILYTKAGNLYKLNHQHDKSGLSFYQAALCYSKLDRGSDEYQSLTNAANSYRKCDSHRAKEILLLLVKITTKEGRFLLAAKQLEDLGQLAEQEEDRQGVVNYYSQAAEYYEMENSVLQYRCLDKVADHLALLEKYQEAIAVYDKLISATEGNNVRRFNAREYIFKILICHLAWNNLLGCRRLLEECSSKNSLFEGSNECKLILGIMRSIEEYDSSLFACVLNAFDNISHLDKWKIILFSRVKKLITAPIPIGDLAEYKDPVDIL